MFVYHTVYISLIKVLTGLFTNVGLHFLLVSAHGGGQYYVFAFSKVLQFVICLGVICHHHFAILFNPWINGTVYRSVPHLHLSNTAVGRFDCKFSIAFIHGNALGCCCLFCCSVFCCVQAVGAFFAVLCLALASMQGQYC